MVVDNIVSCLHPFLIYTDIVPPQYLVPGEGVVLPRASLLPLFWESFWKLKAKCPGYVCKINLIRWKIIADNNNKIRLSD